MPIESTTITEGDRKEKEKEKNPKESTLQFSSLLSRVRLLRPHESQQARPPCPSPTPGVHADSCPLRR